ncbi:unnamed protein product [Peniophora sp. CBMAI 1063]|nr:unnamed protein product [Peniophora sp. CBMAI 1063]
MHDAIIYPPMRRFVLSLYGYEGVKRVRDSLFESSYDSVQDDIRNCCALCVSPDGCLVAFGLISGEINIWDYDPSEDEFLPKTTVEGIGSAEYLEFSPSSRYLMVGSESVAQTWDWLAGSLLHSCTLSGDIACATISDTHLAVAGTTGISLRVIDSPDAREEILFTGHHSPVEYMLFSLDGARLVSRSTDDTICVWDVHSRVQNCRAVMSKGFEHFYLPYSGDDVGSAWLHGPHGELLLQIPQPYAPYVQHLPCRTRIAEYRVTVDWEGAVHGEEWTKCYIGPKYITSGPMP